MDLVSNFVGSISPNKLGINTQGITPEFDLDDKTFSDILEKQMQKLTEQDKTNYINNLGIQSGIDIGDFDHSVSHFSGNQEDRLEAINAVNQSENKFFHDMNPQEMSTSEVLTFFRSLFDSKPTMTDTSNSALFDFERRTAASQYSKYAKNIVTDLGEFVSDALKIS